MRGAHSGSGGRIASTMRSPVGSSRQPPFVFSGESLSRRQTGGTGAEDAAGESCRSTSTREWVCSRSRWHAVFRKSRRRVRRQRRARSRVQRAARRTRGFTARSREQRDLAGAGPPHRTSSWPIHPAPVSASRPFANSCACARRDWRLSPAIRPRSPAISALAAAATRSRGYYGGPVPADLPY